MQYSLTPFRIVVPAWIAAILLLWCVAIQNSVNAQIRLPVLVGDSMILQRDTKLKLWGWASKGENVTVTLNRKNLKAVADNEGKWFVLLPPMKAGGPHTIKISGSNQIILKDVLFGDVWLCAGQSNMVHYLELHKERYADEIAKANNSNIRQFVVPTTVNLQAANGDLPESGWKPATSKHIRRFSVVAYFFAKKIYERYKVPVGIINASVGGTPIEAWISESGLSGAPDLLRVVEKNKDSTYIDSLVRWARELNLERGKQKPGDKGLTDKVPWFDSTFVATNWNTINIPGYWEDQGVKDLDGVVWFRREIDVPSSMTGVTAKIYLGRIVDADFVYINGQLIGKTSYQYPQRRYDIPAGVLKRGKNVIVIRVLNNSDKGGFVPDKPYFLSAGEQTIDLKGYWQYKVGEVYPEESRPVEQFSSQNQPAALYNGMIAPLTNFAIKGVVWYQGESNVTRASRYQKLLTALIFDWRNQWKKTDLPFLYVQLPNFGSATYTPSESQWAELRDAQFKAQEVPHTGMAVAIDLGEWNDIHPGNKKPVGERLALAAQKVAYGESNVIFSGPLYDDYASEGSRIIIRFKNVGGGLTTNDGEELQRFEIAGEDKKFIWANAIIQGSNVVVWNDAIQKPLYVRYAWADNPVGANLYNKEGLPASPFRTDQ